MFKIHIRLFASACILLLLPMTANAVLIKYTSSDLGDGYYLTAEVEIDATSPPQTGLYSESNGLLTSFTLSAFDVNNVFQFSASGPPSTTGKDYVLINTQGDIAEWHLRASFSAPYSGSIQTITQFQSHTGIPNGPIPRSDSFSFFDPSAFPGRLQRSAYNVPGTWYASEIPEPGALALLAAGIGGFLYRRKRVCRRV